MSKIYEALLRAELERTTTEGRTSRDGTFSVGNLLAPETEEPSSALGVETGAIRESFGSDFAEASSAALAQDELVSSDLGMGPLDLSLVPQKPWHPILAALPALADRGAGVEQFRILRSRLAEFREQGPMRTILVSSGLPGEGKSFVAINIAMAFARHKGNRVLIIDGDMRRSSLHKILGTSAEPGLTEYLSGAASLTEVMQRPLPTTGTGLPPGLSSIVFIGGGKDADKAGDLSASSRFAELIEQMSATFDWIIIDSSPANLVSDAVNLARSADGVLLVGREGITRLKTAQQAQAQFKNSNILGFVLNAVRNLPAKSDYYGNYDGYKPDSYKPEK